MYFNAYIYIYVVSNASSAEDFLKGQRCLSSLHLTCELDATEMVLKVIYIILYTKFNYRCAYYYSIYKSPHLAGFYDLVPYTQCFLTAEILDVSTFKDHPPVNKTLGKRCPSFL